MPNWCEGTLKVRGAFENVKRWLKECLTVYDFVRKDDENGQPDFVSVPNADKIEFHYFDDEEFDEIEMVIKDDAHIKGTCRHFVRPYDYFVRRRTDESCVAVLKFKAAWGIVAESFAEMSKEYCVDFRLHGYEMGMEFNQEVIVLKGEVVTNMETKFDDYEWECPFPLLGG